jgi:hypothetical protein
MWLDVHLNRLEKLLLAIAMALPDESDRTLRPGPSRKDILEEVLAEIAPGNQL